MNKRIAVAIAILCIISGCRPEAKVEHEDPKYLRWVGDIEPNPKIDNPDFKTCYSEEEIFQYFNVGEGPQYSGEKTALLNEFNSKYKGITDNNQNGLIRIRFVVNCKGEAGRFRILQSDFGYNEAEFDQKITSQLLEITKGISKWTILYYDDVPSDYYIYLIFKIKNGHLTEILP